MHHEIVNQEEWLGVRKALLVKEKELMRLRDDLNRQIREMPSVEIQKDYVFVGPDGATSLAELFGSSNQLIVYHFMFGPEWEEGCKSCSFLMDHVAPSAVHIADRGVAFTMVSRGPIEKLEAFRKRMGWAVRWVSSSGNDFNLDFGVSVTEKNAEGFEYNYGPSEASLGSELPGLSVFRRDGAGRIYHTYSTYARGLDSFIGAYRLLDITPGGRNEEGLTYGMEWVRHHDRYDTDSGAKPKACH